MCSWAIPWRVRTRFKLQDVDGECRRCGCFAFCLCLGADDDDSGADDDDPGPDDYDPGADDDADDDSGADDYHAAVDHDADDDAADDRGATRDDLADWRIA